MFAQLVLAANKAESARTKAEREALASFEGYVNARRVPEAARATQL